MGGAPAHAQHVHCRRRDARHCATRCRCRAARKRRVPSFALLHLVVVVPPVTIIAPPVAVVVPPVAIVMPHVALLPLAVVVPSVDVPPVAVVVPLVVVVVPTVALLPVAVVVPPITVVVPPVAVVVPRLRAARYLLYSLSANQRN